MPPLSPLAPAGFPAMPAIAGVRFATAACGIRPGAGSDLLLVDLTPGSTAAGALTRSRTAGAPVLWCREALAGGRARGLVVNSGNANAFTGPAGIVAVEETAAAAAKLIDCAADEIFVASTGVIGEPLPTEKIVAALPGLHAALAAGDWEDAARAIMTTDTYPKGAAAAAEIDGASAAIAGIAKGSGMIAPDMATMLAFLFTDARLPAGLLREMLGEAVERSFNAITVDGDTSTSDTVLLFATGAGAATPEDGRLDGFRAALDGVCRDLARQVVRDGEGAQKFVTVTVTGAASDGAARRIGLSIANSPLVKTAIAGADANWGRIVMAVGKAGEAIAAERLVIRVGGHVITEAGGRADGYDEAPVAAHMQGREIDLAVDVGVGSGRATVWTCDLTHGYIDINADYRS
ncbi:MAG: bifunctional glutamate N-acetyltransferase/amino-acid acetyltransferase ArgJ [Alphaproteobacteria bacterium]